MKLNQRTKDILLVISCYAIGIIFLFGGIYFIVNDKFDIVDCIMLVIACIMMFFFGVYGTYQLLFHNKTSKSDSRRDIQKEQNRIRALKKRRQKQQSLVKKHKNMFHEIFFITWKLNWGVNLVILLIGMLLCIPIWKFYDGIPIWGLYVLWGVVLVIFIGYWINTLLDGPVKTIKTAMQDYGFDFEDVNSDFMQGITCIVSGGFINIGERYSVYCNNKMNSFIIRNNQIVQVEKQFIKQELQQEDSIEYVDRICICLYTQTFQNAFGVDDIGADLILEAYQNHGIFTNIVDMR